MVLHENKAFEISHCCIWQEQLRGWRWTWS